LQPEVSCEWPAWQSNLRVDLQSDSAERNSAAAEESSTFGNSS